MAREETRESHTRAAMAKRSNWRLHSIKGPHWGGVCRRVTHFPGPSPPLMSQERIVPTVSLTTGSLMGSPSPGI